MFVTIQDRSIITASFSRIDEAQESMADDHPDILAFLNPPAPPEPPTVSEALAAMDEIAAAVGLPAEDRKKLDVLLSRQ